MKHRRKSRGLGAVAQSCAWVVEAYLDDRWKMIACGTNRSAAKRHFDAPWAAKLKRKRLIHVVREAR